MAVLIIIILIIFVFIAIKGYSASNKSKSDSVEFTDNSYKYEGFVNSLSNKQLEEIHEKLLPVVKKIDKPLIENLAGAKHTHEEVVKRMNIIRNTDLPAENQIYNCRTYGDAEALNKAIVNRMDKMEQDNI